MNNSNVINRDAYADALKCLGILLVIRGHVALFGLGQTDTYGNIYLLMSYAFNMPIFFFLSGYYAYKQEMTGQVITKNIKSKFKFLVLPALAFYSYDCLINNKPLVTLLEEGFGKFWFTITLFYVFLIYYATRAICKSRSRHNATLITLSLAGIIYLSMFSKYEIPLLDFNHLAKYLQYFVAGIIAKMYNEKYTSLITNQLLITFATIFFIVMLPIVSQNLLPGIAHKIVRDLLLRYSGTFMIISWFYCCRNYFAKANSLNRTIAYIGRYTLPIYLLQYFFLPDFSAFSDLTGNIDNITTDIICSVYTLIITAVCLVFIHLLSNSTFIRKILFGIKS